MPSPCWVAQMPSGLKAGLPCSASTRSMASLAYPPPLKKGANHHTAVQWAACVPAVWSAGKSSRCRGGVATRAGTDQVADLICH